MAMSGADKSSARKMVYICGMRSASSDDSVCVNGVATEIITAVLIHRKIVILKYRDMDRSPWSG